MTKGHSRALDVLVALLVSFELAAPASSWHPLSHRHEGRASAHRCPNASLGVDEWSDRDGYRPAAEPTCVLCATATASKGLSHVATNLEAVDKVCGTVQFEAEGASLGPPETPRRVRAPPSRRVSLS